MQAYFKRILEEVEKAYTIARRAREQGLDPEPDVPIPLARNMAERVEGLISSVAPQIVGKGVPQRIAELEKEYGVLDWRVSLIIAREIAEQKFCEFKDKREAMEVGIRAGFAYHTLGVVSAPLEGFVELKLKDRLDGKGKYFSLYFSGPIRGAGGTAMGVALLIADYVRVSMGYAAYDPTPEEIKRYALELQDYDALTGGVQYKAQSEEETFYLIAHTPLEINGDPTENRDVSNYKDLPRAGTPRIRGGAMLVLNMLALKAPKLWKKLSKWKDDFNLSHWAFLEDFLKLQKAKKAGKKVILTPDFTSFTIQEDTEKKEAGEAKGEGKDDKKEEKKRELLPDTSFIRDLVSGRPVLTHPLRHGGLRLRYGRSRTSGYSSVSLHPATLEVLDGFIAIGTQIKTERPGKAASVTIADTLEGPTVLLTDGRVRTFRSRREAYQYRKQIKEILYLGDILVSYGDFYDRAHPLVPPGFTEEEYALILRQQKEEILTHEPGLKELVERIIKDPLHTHPTPREAVRLSLAGMPMHPRYTPYYTAWSRDDVKLFYEYLLRGRVIQDKLLLPTQSKPLLEAAGMHHDPTPEGMLVQPDHAIPLVAAYQLDEGVDQNALQDALREENVLAMLNKPSRFEWRDKAGTFIGARMGRPEKAKMRQLKGSPHGLFPIGEQGGRMRSISQAVQTGYAIVEVTNYYCSSCNVYTIYPRCERCGSRTEIREENGKTYSKRRLDMRHYYHTALKTLQLRHDESLLIKGVRGTSNKDHIPERLEKAILRARHKVTVNKDGTVRYDMTELPITHFKPKEVGTSIAKLRELGYTHDIHGKPLEHEDQVLELKPQDVILGSSPESPDEGADTVLLRVAQFVDDELQRFYKLPPYYNARKPEDLIGQYVIGLAPHTSGGIIGRIIGFSKTQSLWAHPLFHAAMRRDTDGDESCVLLLMDALLNFSRQYLPDRRGGRTMDAPLVLTAILVPSEVDDMVQNLDIAWEYPLELYDAGRRLADPWEVKVPLLGDHLDTPRQYEGIGYTHDTDDVNDAVRCSAYKLLPSMDEKIQGQMELARKIRAVDEDDVARLVVESHLLRDIRGNFRKFFTQDVRCVQCNEKYRRPPLRGVCTKCGGKLVFTISEGSVLKYVDFVKQLTTKYNVSPYLKESIDVLSLQLESVFGRKTERQEGLNAFIRKTKSQERVG